MGKPSRTRDLMGALLLVLVGLLYMTGVTNPPVQRGADAEAAVDVMETSLPASTGQSGDCWI